jgi:hypothetical protein
MADPTPAEQQLDWGAVATQALQAVLTQLPQTGVHKAIVSAHADAKGTLYSVIHDVSVELAGKMGQTLHEIEEPFLPIIAAFVAPILAGLFGAEVNTSEFAHRMARGDGARAGQSIVDGFMKAIIGDAGAEIVPSDAGSKRIAAAAVQASLESTFNAMVPELLSDLLPEIGPHFTAFTELPEAIIRTLGVSRLVRRALTPIVNTTCTVPATWHMNKLHRPTLLGASTLAKQIARNPEKRETWLEDLRREGYSDERIEALLNEQAKFHSVADVDLLVRSGQWAESEALDHLRDQGYDPEVAHVEYQLEDLKRLNSFERQMADAAVDGFVAGRIDEGTAGGFWNGTTLTARDKARYAELAAARRICARRPITSSEAEAAVKAGVLSVVDYRRALERENRDDDAVIVLELMLRAQLDAKKAIEEHRKELEAERAAERKARADAALAKKAAADAKLALQRRGSMSDLEAAYIRGLIPLARVQEVYSATYADDTVGILTALLESKRADYVAQLAAAEAARTRATTRGVNVGELETAVMTGVLTLDQFRRRLDDLKFDAGDADLLTATLAARLQQRDDAERKHDEAAAAAKVRHVDLSTLELLVRRGHRTLDDYRATLNGLGYDVGSQAALVERLQILIDDDAAAARTRADAAAALRNKGLSLDQARRAVILGVAPITSYATFLLDHGFSADAVRVLVAELHFDADEAEAARSRRADAERRLQAGSAPLSDVRRAARLGLIPVDVYYGRLAAAGYTADDVAIESDLLTAEMGDTATRRAAAGAADAAAPSKGLTLGQLAAAVKANAATIDQYYDRAIAIGLSAADADILTRTLQDELDVTAVARQRARDLADASADRELSRSDLEKAVRKGTISLDDYAARLPALGYADDDAALLVAVLNTDIGAGGNAGA